MQKVNKKASRYEFTMSAYVLRLSVYKEWLPKKLFVSWTRHKHVHTSQGVAWECGFYDPYDNTETRWPPSESTKFEVTLYRSINVDDFEEKVWSISLESVRININYDWLTGYFVERG